jgi:hypothetical protein
LAFFFLFEIGLAKIQMAARGRDRTIEG